MNSIYKPKVRLFSYNGGPLRGSDGYQFGFYDAGILRTILEEVDGKYEIWAAPIPQNDEEYEKVVKLVNSPNVQYALVDKDKIVFCVIHNSPGWMSALNAHGFYAFSGDKTNKRLKSAHRPTLLNANFAPEEIGLMIVAPDEYSRYNFSGKNVNVPEEYRDFKVYERLLDGGFVVSKRIIQKAVRNLPVYEPDSSIDMQDYYYDPRIRAKVTNDLLNARVFNARFIFELGIIKGNCFVVDLPEGIDIITSDANIKPEVKYYDGFQFLAEPQGAKEKVITDDQTVINFPKLFRKTDMEFWLSEEYKKRYNDAINGNLLTNWRYIYQRSWKEKESPEENEARARTQYVGYRWTAAGFSVTNSPWLMETIATSHAKPLENRIPIPCAVYEQIVPESLVRMAGYLDFDVNQGDIRRHPELNVHVVNDLDWLEMYESHGGHDEDDFFKLFYREFTGGDIQGKKVVAVRSPNGYGEYSIFNYVEGEWSPSWYTSDGTLVKFPKVNGRGWPLRLSEAIRNEDVSYSGLPSSSQPKQQRSGPYTQDDVLRDVRIAMAGGNVGGYVNACMLHSSVLHSHRSSQLCSLEDAIDKCINPDHILDVRAIDQEASQMISEVIKSGKPIDYDLWQVRGSARHLKPGQHVDLYEGKITQLNKICYSYFTQYCKDIRSWSQENARPSDIIHKLGLRFYTWAVPVLRDFRVNLYNTNSSQDTMNSGSISRNNWENLYSNIVDKIKSFERVEDRHDFVIALYSASINVPTSNGRISDQVIMNSFVYPYLEEALQFYGIAAKPVYDHSNGSVYRTKVTSWLWPQEDGTTVEYSDALEFQHAHSMDSPIDFRMGH